MSAPAPAMTVPAKVTASNELRNLATRIRAAHAVVGSAMQHAIEAGQLLIEAKKQVPRGAWLSWLEDKCEISERTAQAYMRIARQLEQLDDAKAQLVADLSFRDALKQFARTARAVKVLSPSDLETVLTETETTSDTAVIPDVAQRLINQRQFEKIREREAQQNAARASMAVIPHEPMPQRPSPHQALLQRLAAIIDQYRAENPAVTIAEVQETLNELYCRTQDQDATPPAPAVTKAVAAAAARAIERSPPPPAPFEYPELPTFLDRSRTS
jgi:hypothetical protein